MQKRVPTIIQSETAECGIACLTMILNYWDYKVSLDEVRDQHGVSLAGLSLKQLNQIAGQFGLEARVSRCEVEDLKHQTSPVLLHWDFQHFIVLESVKGDRFSIIDPGFGRALLTREEISQKFTGIVVQYRPGQGFAPRTKAKPLQSLYNFADSIRNNKKGLFQVIYLSLLLEFIFLMYPIILQKYIDTRLADDGPLSPYYYIVFLLGISICSIAFSHIRDRLALNLSTFVGYQAMRRILHHIIHLPLGFFEKRSLGRIIEKINIVQDMEKQLIGRMPLVAVDGAMSIMTVTMLFLISAKLGSLAILTALAMYLTKHAYHDRTRDATLKTALKRGEENGFLIETIKESFTMKAQSLENIRYMTWSSLHADSLLSQRELGYLMNNQFNLSRLFKSLSVALLFLVATSLPDFTPGLIFAALAYFENAMQRIGSLIDVFFEVRILYSKLHLLEDLNDISKAPAQQAVVVKAHCDTIACPLPDTGVNGMGMEIRDLAFRYSPRDPLIIDDLNLDIKPGEFVAISGENGTGKTTLLKLILGLYPLERGSVRIDGTAIEKLDHENFRKNIGIVTQEDDLLTGSVTENVTAFSSKVDMDRLRESLATACILEDIERLPMKFNTRVGQLGSPFSAGQKQKLLIARALYKRPRLLVLDEGTANLDEKSEKRILENIKELGITKLFIAHRIRTLEMADRVYCFRKGRLELAQTNGS